mmetsp:Transcript_24329/g.54781  ORF Transcript_24329/g.54781 Transcript_24329/m.54781 type:complete len:266 (+) Transcript_24329:890-1687(+)
MPVSEGEGGDAWGSLLPDLRDVGRGGHVKELPAGEVNLFVPRGPLAEMNLLRGLVLHPLHLRVQDVPVLLRTLVDRVALPHSGLVLLRDELEEIFPLPRLENPVLLLQPPCHDVHQLVHTHLEQGLVQPLPLIDIVEDIGRLPFGHLPEWTFFCLEHALLQGIHDPCTYQETQELVQVQQAVREGGEVCPDEDRVPYRLVLELIPQHHRVVPEVLHPSRYPWHVLRSDLLLLLLLIHNLILLSISLHHVDRYHSVCQRVCIPARG